jgi:hypothetical protein
LALGWRKWELNREGGTCTWGASYLDVAAHRLGELPDNRESQTGADHTVAVVAAIQEEALERPRKLLTCDSRTGVSDGQLSG